MNKEFLFERVIKNLKSKYKNELLLGFRYDEINEVYQIVYIPNTLSFLNEELLFDLYTQIDEVLIPNEIRNVSIFYDSEKEYIDIDKKSMVIECKKFKDTIYTKDNFINKKYALCA